MFKQILLCGILFIVVFFFGCTSLSSQVTTSQGCQYNNPTCGSNYECVNNQCVEKIICGKFSCQTGENSGNCCTDCGCPTREICTNNQCGPSPERLKADVDSYNTISQQDFVELNTLINEESTILDYYNTDLSNVENTFSFSPGYEGRRNLSLKKDYHLLGTISISGGLDNNLDFAIEDSQGNQLISKKRVYGSTQLSFIAPKDDIYRIYLSNKFAILTTKSVTISVSASSKYYYYQQYISWSKQYANKVEIIQQHLTEYDTYVKENEKSLKNIGYNTIQLKTGISDSKTRLYQSINSVKDNIQSMESYFEYQQALKEQEKQQTEAVIDILIKVLPYLVG